MGCWDTTALHFAAFWGHTEMTRYLTSECKMSVHAQDVLGDSPLHDAAKFGHENVVKVT